MQPSNSKVVSTMHTIDSFVCIGPGSPGWITVTEQGIRQSFDMTRVMFSRGNVTEKIRFGKMVRKGDMVLDLYAGIGYFTLPALVHGQAKYVYACEWNPEAVKTLRFNLSDNGLEERATVLEGDCRVLVRNHQLVNMFDRVSLGLLPSSEGGWWTAVQAIRRSTGGWLVSFTTDHSRNTLGHTLISLVGSGGSMFMEMYLKKKSKHGLYGCVEDSWK